MLNDVWVNFQKESEFNPAHCHGGIYSFVIWLKCPSPATFQFTYPNTLGGLNHLAYNTDSSYENMMILFPAQFLHQVYPFYEIYQLLHLDGKKMKHHLDGGEKLDGELIN